MARRKSSSAAVPAVAVGPSPVSARGQPEWLERRRAAARAAERSQAEQLMSPLPGHYYATGYRAVAVGANEGRSYPVKSAEARQEFDREKLIAESRSHHHDNALYRGLIQRLVDNVVGDGFTLQVTGGTEKENADLEGFWAEFWLDPEVRGLWSGPALERQVCTDLAVAGDVGLIKAAVTVLGADGRPAGKAGKLQAIEAERISKGDGGPGVSLTDAASGSRIRSFFVRDYGRSGVTLSSTQREIAAADMIFVANLDRFSATRGMPALVPSFPMLHRINDVCDSNALAWQVLSRLAVKITRKDADKDAYARSRADAAADSSSTRYDLAPRVQDLGWAVAFHGEPGEDIGGIERNIPQQNFLDSLRSFLRVAGLPLGMPLELILLDWSQTNYSSARAALEQAWVGFRAWQKLLADGFMTPTFRWKLDEWRRAGRTAVDPKAIGVSWVCQPFPWLDQLKEAEAWASKLDRGLETHARAVKSLGNDPDLILEARDREFRKAIDRAKKLKTDTGVEVPWEHYAGLAPRGAEANAGRPGKPQPPESPAGPAKPDAPEET